MKKINLKKTFIYGISSITMLMMVLPLAQITNKALGLDYTLVATEGDSDYIPTQIVNGDFTDMPWNDYKKSGKTYTKNNYYKDGSSPASGFTSVYATNNWNTTETSVWRSSLFEWIIYDTDTTVRPFVYFMNKARNAYKDPYNAALSAEFAAGKNVGCIEMNATNQAVFYQDLPTTSMDVIRWSLDHAVRTDQGPSTQTLHVEIGPTPMTGSTITQATGTNSKIDSSKLVKYSYNGVTGDDRVKNEGSLANLRLSKSSQKDGWYGSTGVYIVPKDQKLTRFAFISDSNDSTGNLLDNIVFSTLIGNLQSIKDKDGNLIVTGYWGEHDPTKKLKITIGGETLDVDMTSVCENDFILVIPAEQVGENKKITVYHEDYPGAATEVPVIHQHTWKYIANGGTLTAYCTNTEEADACKYQGEAHSVSISITAEDKEYDGLPYDLADYVSTGAWSQSMQEIPPLKYVGRGSTDYPESTIAPTEPGKYSVRIYGGDVYAYVDFAITGGSYDPDLLEISPIGAQKYTGSPITPEPTVTYDGTTLVKGVDYTLSYEDNVNAGTATVTVTLIGDYDDVVDTTFTINKATIEDVIVSLPSYVYDYTGSPITPEPTVTFNGKALTKGVDYIVEYGENKKAGEDSGSVKVILIGDNFEGNTTVNFDINAKGKDDIDVAVGPLEEGYDYTGEEIKPTIVLKDGDKVLEEGVDYDITYEDNVEPGTGKIIITFKGDYEGEMEIPFTINKVNVDDVNISLDDDSYQYTGKQITPEPIVQYKGENLTKGEDYTVTYGENIEVGEDEGTVKVTLIGDKFEGEKTLYFDITPKGKDDIEVTVGPLEEGYDYTGEEIKPEIELKDGDKVLEEGVDYILTYEDNVEPGTGKVIITFIGNYDGEMELPFTINKVSADEVTASLEKDSYEYTGNQITPEPIVKFNGDLLVKNEDYIVSYGENIEVGEDNGTVVVTLIGSKFEGEKTLYFDITPKDAKDVVVTVGPLEDGYDYTGEEIKPEIELKDGDKVLEEGIDYVLTYEDNIEPGTGKVIITFIGDYEGEKELPFTIKKVDSDECVVTIPQSSYEYIGEQITPTPSVSYKGENLVAGIDYIVTYGENVEVGEDSGSVTVTFIGDKFEGEKTLNFDITPRSSSHVEVTVGPLDGGYPYTGEEIKPEIELKDGDKVLEEGVDYILSYENNIEIGTDAKVIVTFIGDYEGEMELPFEIRKVDISEISCELNGTVFDYTGSEIEPGATVSFGSTMLTEGVDYIIEYTDNIEIGTAHAKITLIGKYEGEFNKTFTIKRAIVGGDELEININGGNDIKYNGKSVKPEVTVKYKGVELVEGVDYEVVYSNNSEPGEGIATINFIGKYSGKVTKTFNILKSPDIVHIIMCACGVIYLAVTLVWLNKTEKSERRIDKKVAIATGILAIATIACACFATSYASWIVLAFNGIAIGATLLNFAFNK